MSRNKYVKSVEGGVKIGHYMNALFKIEVRCVMLQDF